MTQAPYSGGQFVHRPEDPTARGYVALGAAAAVTLCSVLQPLLGLLERERVYEEQTGWVPYDVVLICWLVLTLVSYALTCSWLWLARTNAEIMDPGVQQRRGRSWVWLGWWVPIVSFWFPFMVVQDVQQASTRRQPKASPGWWWTGWIITLVVGRAPSERNLLAVDVVLAVATVVTLALWTRVVLEIDRGQRSWLRAAG